ncbi:hypothetical protein EHO57_13915 [Leptospira langatensis]|uniref:Uncharacterized protein n=1 Tax=Leptospira langatensis TaxID=2484983 RepID=A0A5R2ATH2_9LEPT|nr:hypothetical protein [Leptospira langatensis]TGJ99852.1 hypothetical protein EHO57_13915 [Leptospira langatensis]
MSTDSPAPEKGKAPTQPSLPVTKSGDAKETPDSFLLKKENELGRVLSDRFRALFFRKLKGSKNYEEAWKSINGN